MGAAGGGGGGGGASSTGDAILQRSFGKKRKRKMGSLFIKYHAKSPRFLLAWSLSLFLSLALSCEEGEGVYAGIYYPLKKLNTISIAVKKETDHKATSNKQQTRSSGLLLLHTWYWDAFSFGINRIKCGHSPAPPEGTSKSELKTGCAHNPS